MTITVQERECRMNKQRVALCGRCIALARDAYQVTESTGWRKVDCAHCGKRRYGAECALGRKEKKDDQERV